MKEKIIVFLFRLVMLLSLATSCQMQDFGHEDGPGTDSEPQHGAFVPQPSGSLFDLFDGRPDYEVVAFDLPNGTGQPWRVEAWRDGFLSPGFEAKSSPDADAAFTAADLITLTGVVVGQKKGEVRLVLMRDRIGGSVIFPDETWNLSPQVADAAFKGEGFVLEAASRERVGTPLRCGVEDGSTSQAGPGEMPDGARAASSCSVIQVRAQGDYEYFRDRAGSNMGLATFAIAVHLHNASQKFRDVGNSLQTESILVFSSPSNPLYYPVSSSIYGLLDDVREFHNFFFANPSPTWDAVILFTGKSTSPSNIGGLAYLRSLCKYSGEYSYAVVKANYSSTLVTNILAHELGHIVGAGHTTDVLPGSACLGQPVIAPPLMHPNATASAQARFSPCSRDQILWHRWFHNSCLTAGPCD